MALRTVLILVSALQAAASPVCPTYAMRECAGHGRCITEGLAPFCECDDGFAGIDCAVALAYAALDIDLASLADSLPSSRVCVSPISQVRP